MVNAKPCTVALLRPPETSWMAFAQQVRERDGVYVGDGHDAYTPAIDDWIDEYRLRLLELAGDLKLPCVVNEYQLHGEGLGGRRRQTIEKADVFTTIDPPRWLCWFMRDVMKHDPKKRAVIAYTSSDLRDGILGILAGAKLTQLVREWASRPGGTVLLPGELTVQGTIPRIRAFHARDENEMAQACTQTFRYPDCDDVERPQS